MGYRKLVLQATMVPGMQRSSQGGCFGLAEPASAASATASATARAAATATARPRARRREGVSEPRGEVADRKRARTRAEVAARRDPVDRARLVQLLGHVDVCALEHALRDPEG